MKREIIILAIVTTFGLAGCGKKSTSNPNEGLAILSGKVNPTAVAKPQAAIPKTLTGSTSLPPLGVTKTPAEPVKAPVAVHTAQAVSTKPDEQKPIEKHIIHKETKHVYKKVEHRPIEKVVDHHQSKEQELMNQCIAKEKQWATYVCGNVVAREMEGQ